MAALKLKTLGVPKLKTVDHLPIRDNLKYPALGGLTNIGNPGIDAVRAAAQTASTARQNMGAPTPPAVAGSPISKIRVRRKRFRYAPSAPSGGFTLPATKY